MHPRLPELWLWENVAGMRSPGGSLCAASATGWEDHSFMDMYWPVFIAAILVAAAGAAVVRHRQDSISGIPSEHRSGFSRIGQKIANHSRAAGTLGAGIAAILFGILGMVLAYVVANDHWER